MTYLNLLREQAVPTEDQEVSKALHLLDLAGLRLAGEKVAMWQDLDCREIREALETIGMGNSHIIYLESRDAPIGYKVRTCPDRLRGEPFSAWRRRAEAEQEKRSRRRQAG